MCEIKNIKTDLLKLQTRGRSRVFTFPRVSQYFFHDDQSILKLGSK